MFHVKHTITTEEIMENNVIQYVCNDCPRQCSAIRGEQGRGYCRMGLAPVVARAALHFDEEPVISGVNGSGTVFFSGCSLQCRYCQNYSLSHEGFGKPITVERLREIYWDLHKQGAHNINLVNPTHFAEPILQSMEFGTPDIPFVWNSSGYERVETLRRFEGKINIYLPDMKYIRTETARRYSGAADYFEYAAPALKEMQRQVGKVRFGEDGMLQSGLIVRHLILPGCVEESKEVLTWIRDNLPDAWVSVMAQYVPFGDVKGVDQLERRITEEEYDEIMEHLDDLEIENGFVQELEAADTKYIPRFDLTGV